MQLLEGEWIGVDRSADVRGWVATTTLGTTVRIVSENSAGGQPPVYRDTDGSLWKSASNSTLDLEPA